MLTIKLTDLNELCMSQKTILAKNDEEKPTCPVSTFTSFGQ